MCDCILCFECVICLCLSCHLEILELSHRWYLYHAESPPHYLVGTGLAAKYNMSETNEFITSRQINSTEAMHILLRLHHHHNSFLIYLFFIKLLLYKSPSKTPQNVFFCVFVFVFCSVDFCVTVVNFSLHLTVNHVTVKPWNAWRWRQFEPVVKEFTWEVRWGKFGLKIRATLEVDQHRVWLWGFCCNTSTH